MAKFKQGMLVFHIPSKRKGEFIGYNRDMKTAAVSFITAYNKETGERTTKLENVNLSDLVPYRRKSRKHAHKIKIKYFDNELPKIEKIKVGNWIDLRAAEDVELKQFEFKLIPLGVAMELPKGYEANIVPRSSTFKNFGILQTNSYGVVDESYCGDNDQWFFPALAMRDTVIKKGDRICQFRINRVMGEVEFIEVENLGNEDRGGHGSTGVK